MENYLHAVFFEANNLTDTDLKHIERYFQIKRRSGGGECQFYKAGANTYKICFKDKEAQERVLTHKDHIIILHGQDKICISLRCVDESDKQPKASDQQTCASGKQMEKVFDLDLYLLRFLGESPSTMSDLKQRLSKLSSSFQIRIDSTKLVVVKDQDAHDSCPLQKWNLAVEQVLAEIQNRYSTYFEVETDRLAILRENSFHSTENLRIYDEETFAVVVGEREKVEKITKIVDALQPKQHERECHISEKQFALVKEQFEHSRMSSFSNIKMKQGTVVLKGPEKEVDAAEHELLNLVRGIKEKRIPLHHTLLTFVESSGGIEHFQTQFQQRLHSLVLFENAGSELVLLSMSDGALTEAADAVKLLCFIPECEKLLNTSDQKLSSGDVKNIKSECKLDRKIILMGKTGDGKSSTGNTILQKDVFTAKTAPESETIKCDVQSAMVDGRKLTVIDTPGIFDTKQDEETVRSEVIQSAIECSPSVDAIVIVLKIGRYSKQEEEVIAKILNYFGENTFKHAVVLFTHGEQLDNQNIEEFVKKSSKLQKLVDTCGGCHVIDNKYWNDSQSLYKNNEVVGHLLDTVDKIVENYGPCTNDFFLQAEADIQNEMKKLEDTLTPAEKRDKAKSIVHNQYLIKLAGVSTGAIIGAFLGIYVAIASLIELLKTRKFTKELKAALGVAVANKAVVCATAAVETGVLASALATEGTVAGAGIGAAAGVGIAAGCVVGAAAAAGALGGGVTAWRASNEADSVWDAIENAAKANFENAKSAVHSVERFSSGIDERMGISKK